MARYMAPGRMAIGASPLSLLILICAYSLCAADQQIRPRMEEFVRKGDIAGCVTLVARHGRLASLEVVGYQNLEQKLPMRADTIFQVMSNTKPVTAVAVMMLAETGLLVLNDPVEKYLPEFHRSAGGFRAMTIRDLMTHTSGLSSEDPKAIWDPEVKLASTLAEVASLISQQPLESEPGTRYRYSGPGFAVLGRIIEVVSGRRYEDFLERRIFKPLRMHDSFFFPPPRKRRRVAQVYEREAGVLRPARVDLYRQGAKYANPAGGLFSTAADMAAFCQMMLNGGAYRGTRVLSRASVETMTRIQFREVNAATGRGLGLSVVINPSPSLPLLSPGSYGHSGAFGTYAWIDPQKDLVGVFLTQIMGDTGNTARNTFLKLAGSSVILQ